MINIDSTGTTDIIRGGWKTSARPEITVITVSYIAQVRCELCGQSEVRLSEEVRAYPCCDGLHHVLDPR